MKIIAAIVLSCVCIGFIRAVCRKIKLIKYYYREECRKEKEREELYNNIVIDISHLEQQKRDYLQLYNIIEHDQNMKTELKKNKIISLDNKIYMIDKKLNILYSKLDG